VKGGNLLTLNSGSIEYIILDVKDRLKLLTDLSVASPTFTVLAPDATYPYTDESAVVDGMKVKCLIDTTDLDEGRYKLWVKFNASPETPVLGPIEFYVDA
jgi:hypothetical protein